MKKITDAVLILLSEEASLNAAGMADRINRDERFAQVSSRWPTVKADQVYAAMSGLRSKGSETRNYIEPVDGRVGKKYHYRLTGAGKRRAFLVAEALLESRSGKPSPEKDAEPPASMAFRVLQSNEPTWPVDAPFKMHDLVRKKGRASWRGRVVGWYRTELTDIGFAVESTFEPGSVQIYPATALIAWDGDGRTVPAT